MRMRQPPPQIACAHLTVHTLFLTMQPENDPCGPLYIYNGPANLQELERVNLTGARIFFNGSYSLRDLRNVNFLGATVFMNGQEKVSSHIVIWAASF